MHKLFHTIRKLFVPFPIHPLWYITASFMCGIALLKFFFLWQFALIILVCGSITSIFLVYCNKPYHLAFMLYSSALLGAYLHYRCIDHYHALHHQLGNSAHTIQVTIVDIEPNEHRYFKQKITVSVSHPITHKLWLYLHNTQGLHVGDEIKAHNIIYKQPTSESFRLYQLKNNIAATLFLTKLNYTGIHRPSISWQRGIWQFKTNLWRHFKQHMSPSLFALFSGIFLGNKTNKQLQQQFKEQFRSWGISHYLARSGLHVALVALIWYFLLNLLPLPFTIKQLLLLILCISYGLLSWPSIAFSRAFFCFLFHKLCMILRLPSNFLHLLIMVCLITLLQNPIHLFFLDFQLTFALTAALGWLNLIRVQKC